MELQEEVFNALTAALGGVAVVKYTSEYRGEYPVVVYREMSNIPALYGDDEEIQRWIVYQVSIGTLNDDYVEVENVIEGVMRGLGFVRVESKDVKGDNVDSYWREIKFRIFWRN